MIKIIDAFYKARITFDDKKILSNLDEEKVKSIFNELKFIKINEITTRIGNKDDEIIFNEHNVYFTTKDHTLIKSYIKKVSEVLNIDIKNNKYPIEISKEAIINDDEKPWDFKEKCNVIASFFEFISPPEKIITSIEYMTLMSPKDHKVVNMRIKLYDQGIAATAITLLDDIDKMDKFFEDLIYKVETSTVVRLLLIRENKDGTKKR